MECYAETLGITLGQLGIDTDGFGVNYGTIINDFQQHLLYGFMVAVLVAMSNTSLPDLARMAADKGTIFFNFRPGWLYHSIVPCTTTDESGSESFLSSISTAFFDRLKLVREVGCVLSFLKLNVCIL